MVLTKLEGTPLLPLRLNSFENTLSNDNNLSTSSATDSFSTKSRNYKNWSPCEEGVTLAWDNLSVSTHIKINGRTTCKRIINDGAVKAGSLVALMGASGSGKSTLMSSLAYRNTGETTVEGNILINGRQIGNYMKYLCGYMDQDDIFVGSLTVLEHMNIMAQLKLDRRVTKEQRNIKIYELLKNLGLLKCKDTKIGMNDDSKTLSGGERKRLGFATVLLTDPPLIFCDEPTTGLDSHSARNIISIMNLMSLNGKTIICTIHQPSSEIFGMFSQLILLAEGRIAYMGTVKGAIDFFEQFGFRCPITYNPADFFIEKLAITPGNEQSSRYLIKKVCDNYTLSHYQKEIEIIVKYEFHMGRAVQDKIYTVRTNFKGNMWWTKLFILIYRWFIEILREPTLQISRIMQKIGIALMVGLCYYQTDSTTQTGVQSIEGLAFILTSENTFSPMYSILDEFPRKYSLFLREYKSGLYSPIIYYLSRIISMLPGLIVEPIIFVIIIYWLTGLRPTTYAFLMTNLVGILTMNVSVACGIFFSNAFNSVPTAMSYLVPFDAVLIITAGLFIKLDVLNNFISWTKYLSWLMYSTEAISIIQWSGVTNLTCNGAIEDLICLNDGTQILDKYSFSEANLARDLLGMIGLCLIFYLLGFLCFLHKIIKKQG